MERFKVIFFVFGKKSLSDVEIGIPYEIRRRYMIFFLFTGVF